MPFGSLEPATHILSYTKREISNRPNSPAKEAPLIVDGLLKPAAHTFGEEWLWNRFARGDDLAIWQFSCLRFGKSVLPPSLDAMVAVAAGASQPDQTMVKRLGDLLAMTDGAGRRTYRYGFEAGPESFFLPWADATNLLFELRFVSKDAKQLDPGLRKFPSRIPLHFQSSRILTRNSAKRIHAHALDVLQRRRAFISYRWEDGTDAAVAVAQQFSRDGYACWWDRWGMSRSVAEQKASIREDSVCDIVERACEECSLAVVVNTAGYGESPWTKWEYDVLLRLQRAGRIKIQQFSPGADFPTQWRKSIEQID